MRFAKALMKFEEAFDIEEVSKTSQDIAAINNYGAISRDLARWKLQNVQTTDSGGE
jgi:hypothetical protein